MFALSMVYAPGLRFEDHVRGVRAYDRGSASRAVTERVQEAFGGDEASARFARGWDPHTLEAAILAALADAVGPWSAAFTWSAGDGGLVCAYCCPSHSLPGKGQDGRAAITRVLDALDEWCVLVRALADTFDALHARTQALPVERALAEVANELALFVLDRNRASDAWYRGFAQLLTWYVDSIGLDARTLAPEIDRITEGRFTSWVAPSTEAREAAAEELGLELAVRVEGEAAATEDALAAWRAVRARTLETHAYGPAIPACWDGHTRFIEGAERRRDEARAQRMLAALRAVRARASRGDALTFALLASWQRIVLGTDQTPAFRRGDAYAKGGRERYALDDATERRFASWLAESNDTSVPVLTRAARVYLDVAFTHPFEDGNARAARLALDFVLTREGLSLLAVEPLFLLPRYAADEGAAPRLAYMLSRLVGRSA